MLTPVNRRSGKCVEDIIGITPSNRGVPREREISSWWCSWCTQSPQIPSAMLLENERCLSFFWRMWWYGQTSVCCHRCLSATAEKISGSIRLLSNVYLLFFSIFSYFCINLRPNKKFVHRLSADFLHCKPIYSCNRKLLGCRRVIGLVVVNARQRCKFSSMKMSGFQKWTFVLE